MATEIEGSLLNSMGSNELTAKITAKMLPFLNKVGTGLKAVFYMGVAFALGWSIWYFFLRFKDKATVLIHSGGQIREVLESPCMVYHNKRTNSKKIILMKKYKKVRLSLPLLEGKYRYISGRKDIYFFWLDDNLQLQPSTIELTGMDAEGKPLTKMAALGEKVDKFFMGGMVNLNIKDFSKDDMVKIQPRPQERDAWAAMERKAQQEKIQKENFLLKYKEILLPLIAYGILFLIYYFGLKELGSMGRSIGGGLQAIATSCMGRL